MKNVLKEKFGNNALVKPLYRKLKSGNKIKPKILIVDKTFKLDGDGFSVKRNIVHNNSGLNRKQYISKTNKILLCGSRGDKTHLFDKGYRTHSRNGLSKGRNMLSGIENRKPNCELEGIEDKTNKFVQADNEIVVVHKVTNSWLRLYPSPKHPGEPIRTIIFRCLLCQLGLCSMLILWTTVWVFVIQAFEGPYEIKVSLDFEREQNLLVIDLATELRQIAPLSLKWRNAIERRIQDERQLTTEAVSRGARILPGQYWDLSGTFLFTVYVMTALGFGAPVPQTLWGRTSALIYAIFAVPTHVYLMLNASMCIVVHVEAYLKQLRCSSRDKRPFVLGSAVLQNDSPNCSRSSEVLKAPNRSSIGKKIMRLISVLGACRSVPLIAIMYYVCGAAVFGFARGNTSLDIAMFPLEFTTSGGLDRHLISVLGACRSVPLIAIVYYVCGAAVFGFARGNTSLDIAMFPLEFTTSGGLDRVKGHVRILYGFYVEGAMMLLSCGLATLRRHSGAAVTCMAEKYKLFDCEK